MGFAKRLVRCPYWLYAIGTGSIVFVGDCLPNIDDFQSAVQSNLLGTGTAIIDTIFIMIANAIINPIAGG